MTNININVSYLRISDSGNGNKKEISESITNQRQLIRAYAAEHDIMIHHEYVDEGISGITMQRPGMQRLLSDILSKNIKCIFVKDITRFSRNYMDIGFYINEYLPRYGVKLVTVAGRGKTVDSQCVETELAGILSSYYCLETSQKVKNILNYKKSTGICAVPRVPYGYRNENGKLIVEQEKAKIVQFVFQQYKEKKSFALVAQLLNQKGIRSPGGKKWGYNTVKRILNNEMYRGTWIYGKTESGYPNYSITKRIPSDLWKRIENHHEKIISDELFFQIQEILSYKRYK